MPNPHARRTRTGRSPCPRSLVTRNSDMSSIALPVVDPPCSVALLETTLSFCFSTQSSTTPSSRINPPPFATS
ncbi:hypothetical protein V8C34DRAFT_290229 [Trichoderma compactum]